MTLTYDFPSDLLCNILAWKYAYLLLLKLALYDISTAIALSESNPATSM